MADLAEVRELHGPSRFSDTDSSVYCFGCDADGYEVETPRWPCRTAEIVYAKSEVLETVWAAKMHAKWIKQMKTRNPGRDDRRGVSWIAMAYEKMLEHALGLRQCSRTALWLLRQERLSRSQSRGTLEHD